MTLSLLHNFLLSPSHVVLSWCEGCWLVFFSKKPEKLCLSLQIPVEQTKE